MVTQTAKDRWSALKRVLYNPRRCSNPDTALIGLREHLGRPELTHAALRRQLTGQALEAAVRYCEETYPDQGSAALDAIRAA